MNANVYRALVIVGFCLVGTKTNTGAQQAAVAAEPRVVERGADYRVWRVVTEQVTNEYCEIGTGMHYWKDGWQETKAQFQIFPGGAIAAEGRFQLIIAPDIAADAAVDLLTPDGKRFRSSPRWLAYYNRTTRQSEIIAAVKSCAGKLVENNVLIFDDPFDALRGMIRYTYQPWGIEQDIVLLDPTPLDPKLWGFNNPNDDVVLEMWSEFHESPQPDAVTPAGQDPSADVTLDFGQARIGPGKAFSLGAEDDAVAVTKTWASVENRQFLIEAVRQQDLDPLLAKLGKAALNGKPVQRARNLAQGPPALGRAGLLAQGVERLRKRERRKQSAAVERAPNPTDPGVVLDYSLVTSTANWTFEAGKTYLATNTVSLSGTTRIEPCVVKFSNVTNSTTGRLSFSGSIDCATGPGRPAIFTGKDDDSIGDLISGSTGAPGTNRYALRVFELSSTSAPYDLHDLHIRYADKAFAMGVTGVRYNVRHTQIANVNYGFYNFLAPSTLCGRNILLVDALTGIFNSSTSANSLEHLTCHGVKDFRNSTAGTVNGTNCLLICVTNNNTFQASNCVSSSLSDSGVFTNVGAGRHYLVSGSPYRDAGTTNIDPTLLSDLKSKTTYPPLVLGGDFTVDTVLTPQAQRDTDVPDLGFEYDPTDYLVSQRWVTNAMLTLSNGVVLGIYGTNGLLLSTGGKVVSVGTPENMNRILPYYMVQECPTNFGSFRSAMALDGNLSTNYPQVDLRFTDVPFLNQGNTMPQLLGSGYVSPARLVLRDCRFMGSYLSIVPHLPANLPQVSIGLTNNAVEACIWAFYMGYSSDETPVYLQIRNNLFYRGSLSLSIQDPMAPWYVHDNLFYTNQLTTAADAVTNSNNGYYITPVLSATMGTNKTLSTVAFETGRLGGYYYPTNAGAGSLTDLVNNGSRTAANATLYHYTTATNQTKEAGSTVDIGFHYVAVNASGLPVDTDGDGMPDYLEDANGNGGAPDSGESDWQGYNSFFGLTGTPGLQVFTPLK